MDCRGKADESAQYYEDALGYAKPAGRKKHHVLHIKHDTDSDYADAEYTCVNESITGYCQRHDELQAIDFEGAFYTTTALR